MRAFSIANCSLRGPALCIAVALPALAAAAEPAAQIEVVAMTSHPNPSAPGEAATFSAIYRLRGIFRSERPPGRVLFSDNGLTLGTVPAIAVGSQSGSEANVHDVQATMTVRLRASGRHIVTATYLDESEHLADLISVEVLIK